MRFFADGPQIPDELLIARDEGRVAFFCGAGICKEYAKLPDFVGLTDCVIRKLGAFEDDDANKMFKTAQKFHSKGIHDGTISMDRIFGALEHEFEKKDIVAEIANEFGSKHDHNLKAHEVLLDLATTPEGNVHLVTTNFDRLFEKCKEIKNLLFPPNFDLNSQSEMNGLYYLHGCLKKDSTGSENDCFVLSSGDFGSAYLAEGWATAFVRQIVERYIVVFVGYSADDPPMRYLLEALNKSTNHKEKMYAFQPRSNSRNAQWNDKGVTEILYDDSDGHQALWKSLEKWAERAKNPELWIDSIITVAQKQPENLLPFERGQVAHIVSTVEGAKKFALADPPPPAKWLFVFDPECRYIVQVGSVPYAPEQGNDPIQIFNIDSDNPPKFCQRHPDQFQRVWPEDTWDAFLLTNTDRKNLLHENYPAVYGHRSINPGELPSRLLSLGEWICKVADQSEAVRWAARKNGINKRIQRLIGYRLDCDGTIPETIRNAWRYLFEYWCDARDDVESEFSEHWYPLLAKINKFGWGFSGRMLSESIRPRLVVDPPESNLLLSSGYEKVENINILFNKSTKYPMLPSELTIPDESLAEVIREYRKNIEYAVALRAEIGEPWWKDEGPISERDQTGFSSDGFLKYLQTFSTMFERLVSLDYKKAQQEFSAWPANDETAFSSLRVWASHFTIVVSVQDFYNLIIGLPDDVFWSYNRREDLVNSIAKRWEELSEEMQSGIEERIIAGYSNKDDVEDEKNATAVKDNSTNDFLKKLSNAGCTLSLRANQIFHSPKTNVNPQEFLTEKMNAPGIEGVFNRNRIFSDLIPRMTIDDLPQFFNLASNHNFKIDLYSKFLEVNSEKENAVDVSLFIAGQFISLPKENIFHLAGKLADWLGKNCTQFLQYPQTFNQLMNKILELLESDLEFWSGKNISGDIELGWYANPLESPAGKVAHVLFKFLFDSSSTTETGIPKEGKSILKRLLALKGVLRRDAIIIISRHFSWCFHTERSWVETHLLSILNGVDVNKKIAFWAGFLNDNQLPSATVYKVIKKKLLALVDYNEIRHFEEYRLIKVLIHGWNCRNKKAHKRLISNNEMRTVLLNANDNFRMRILEQITPVLRENEDGHLFDWQEFFQNVWPRQKYVKTPGVSARLCNLTFSNRKLFPKIYKVIAPLISTADCFHLKFHEALQNKIPPDYPYPTLEILCQTLPAEAASWPYKIEEVLTLLNNDPKLRLDPRLIMLRRKRNSL